MQTTYKHACTHVCSYNLYTILNSDDINVHKRYSSFNAHFS